MPRIQQPYIVRNKKQPKPLNSDTPAEPDTQDKPKGFDKLFARYTANFWSPDGTYSKEMSAVKGKSLSAA